MMIQQEDKGKSSPNNHGVLPHICQNDSYGKKKKKKKKKTINRDFPGGPVVKTPCFQNAGDMGLVAGLGIKIPHTPLSMAK